MWQEERPCQPGQDGAGAAQGLRHGSPGALRGGGLGMSKSEAFESDHSRNTRANQGAVPLRGCCLQKAKQAL